MSKRSDLIATLNRGWRPFVGWGVGATIVALPIGLVILKYEDKIDNIVPWIGLYTAMSSLWIALAGIRQINKHKDADMTQAIALARIERGDTIVYEEGIPYADEIEEEPRYVATNPLE